MSCVTMSRLIGRSGDLCPRLGLTVMNRVHEYSYGVRYVRPGLITAAGSTCEVERHWITSCASHASSLGASADMQSG
jgi:hypothetical protein